MKSVSKNVVLHTVAAAALSAGFNSDWAKKQFETLRRDAENGGLQPFIPWILAAGLFYFATKGK